MLFGLLFFIPVLGLAVGTAFGALFGATEKAGMRLKWDRRARHAGQLLVSGASSGLVELTLDRPATPLAR